MEKQWAELTREEKRAERVKNYLNPPNIKFKDGQAEKIYKERATRLLDVMMCKEPDRVPVSLPIGHYPAYYAGYDFKTVMYDYKACREAWTKFMYDFYDSMDSLTGLDFIFSGKVMDIMDYKNFKWPGHGVGDDVTTFQFVEGAYMSADEYDLLLKDPSDFGFRTLTPRTVGAAEALKYFPPLNTIMGAPMAMSHPFANPQVRASFKRMIEAGEEFEKQQKELMKFNIEFIAAGFPEAMRSMGLAPFDLLGDFLRGTDGAAIDIYRRPEKVLETIDMITEQSIPSLISSVDMTKGISVSFMLHKGDDTFMSQPQFEKFYWPSLKKIIDALIEEGIMVFLFAEGSYNKRLDIIGDFPKGWVMWLFDQTDMANAKKMIGDRCAISGNVPASLMVTGTPKEVKEYCRKLIEICAPGGGYQLAGGCTATETTNPDNFRVFMEAAVEYGTY